MGKTLILLKESHYSLNPPTGKVLFRYKEDMSSKELPLVESRQVDERIPFQFLNPLQSLFFYEYEGGNALVCAPTSAGKSLIAHLFMRDKEGRKVYTAPTKSLVYEKASELRRYYESVEVRTGESILESYKKVKADVVISTYEHLVYSLRNSADWVRDISCLVFDEIHQITKRWILEEAITYALDKELHILGLSATLPFYEELSRWIKAELVIYSEWRPVPLVREIKPLKDFKPARIYKERDAQICAKLFNAMFELSKPDEQTLIFVPQKRLGWKLLEVAKEEKIGIMNKTTPFEHDHEREPEIAFHNADVPKEERQEIEKAFRDGKIKKLIATQTLAYGVNLPADRVIILVRMFNERGSQKIIPDTSDILQMEGRAGRLGIKEVGYSHLLTYGASTDKLSSAIEAFFQKPKDTNTVNFETLILFVLLGFHYEGENYEKFLKKTYSYRNIKRSQLYKVVDFLLEKGYLKDNRLTDKAHYCIRSGLPPTKFEEFLRRKLLQMDTLVTVRPLLHMKKFDTLYYFVEKGESFEEDDFYVGSKLTLCGNKCYEDNTHQFIFYTEGLTFKYPNISSPPGEFSYLGTDALHLIRMLIDLKKLGFWHLKDTDILGIAHSVKYGLTLEFAPLGGIKGIGHIRANLLKRVLMEEGVHPPALGSRVEDFLQTLEQTELKERLVEKLITDRKLEKERAKKEAETVLRILKNNKDGFLVDDKILLAFGLFKMGERAYRLKKSELIKELLWNLPSPSWQ
ncbi:DEAD/DEAH box helicase [Hydrogenobacter thermophilus]|uniref:DEAD/DEAH box helicase n=1 Tax=Hydrogenobacter thermophilus TaxID=940 RepID=UPI0030FA53E2